MANITTLSKQGAFDSDLEGQVNTNFSNINAQLATIVASLPAGGTTDTITALAGGAKPGTLLTTLVNRVTVVATAGDSVSLPAAVAGLVCAIINDAAKSLQVFGLGTDTINDVATATGIPVGATSMAIFFCSTTGPAGKWYSLGQWALTVTKATVLGALIAYQDANYIASETGANNGLVAALLDESGNAVTVAAGLRVSIKLGHSLQAGANTFNLNSHGTDSIKKTSNPATDLSVTAVSGSILTMIFDGTVWQVQGQ
jgi:hypothetical protein